MLKASAERVELWLEDLKYWLINIYHDLHISGDKQEVVFTSALRGEGQKKLGALLK